MNSNWLTSCVSKVTLWLSFPARLAQIKSNCFVSRIWLSCLYGRVFFLEKAALIFTFQVSKVFHDDVFISYKLQLAVLFAAIA